MLRNGLVLAALGLSALLAGPAPAQKEKVYKRIPTEQLETLLKDLGIQYKKVSGVGGEGAYYYDYERGAYKVRLGYYDGSSLWASVNFPPTTPAKINQWNIDAKFSRAVLVPGD